MAKIIGFNPLTSALAFVQRWMAGKLRFISESVDLNVRLPDGSSARIFRHAVNDLRRFASPSTLFHIQFEIENGSFETHRRLSLLLIPFFTGLRGFRGKCWCVDETRTYHGFYAWQGRRHAEAYAISYAMRFMAWRAKPGTLKHEIVDMVGNPYNIFPHKDQPLAGK